MAPMPFPHSSFFQELDVTFWHHRKSQAHLLFALPQPWKSITFPKCRGSFHWSMPTLFPEGYTATGWHGTSLLIGPWIPDFNMCLVGFILLRVRKSASCVSAKLFLSLKPAAWGVCGVSSPKGISWIWRRMGQGKLSVIH